jgi:uncharacterized DUF497 family protein
VHVTWDETKSRANRAKHGVSFEVAERVFDDPRAISEQDRVVGYELRWQTIGVAEAGLLLLVAHSYYEGDQSENRDDMVRIISARRTTPSEWRRYARSYEG